MSTTVRFRTCDRFDPSDNLCQQLCDVLMMDCVSLSRDNFTLSGSWSLGVVNAVIDSLNNSPLFNTYYTITFSENSDIFGTTYTLQLIKI
jgi:hypothetical protein